MTSLFSDATILHHATKAKVNAIATSLAAEYPAVSLIVTMADDGTTPLVVRVLWQADAATDLAETGVEYPVREVPKFSLIASDVEEAGFDPEAMEVAPTPSGSVVAETYRAKYREQSTTGRSCGDWLAEWFATETVDAKNRTDIDAVHTIFDLNGLDMTAKWALAKGARGWQGRFRMNGRQVLEKRVAKSGFVVDVSGTEHNLPADALAILREKHAKWLAKEAKADARTK